MLFSSVEVKATDEPAVAAEAKPLDGAGVVAVVCVDSLMWLLVYVQFATPAEIRAETEVPADAG